MALEHFLRNFHNLVYHHKQDSDETSIQSQIWGKFQVEGQDALPPTIYRKASPPWKGIDEKVWEEVPREREREREYSNYWTSVL